MSHKRPHEPIGPTTIPGKAMDPKIPPNQAPELDKESDEERLARESEKAFDQAYTRIPPG